MIHIFGYTLSRSFLRKAVCCVCVLQCAACVCCNVLQCVAVCCSSLFNVIISITIYRVA